MQTSRTKWFYSIIFFFGLFGGSISLQAQVPSLLLADSYQPSIKVQDYWVSEKYDGYRAYWNGRELISRQGNIFSAPSWFIENFPSTPMDGELWIGRGQFELLASVVKQRVPDERWRDLRYMVFDLPKAPGDFDQRLLALQKLEQQKSSSYWLAVAQVRVSTHDELMARLRAAVELGAEGLMLHRGQSVYRSGRSTDLIKLKPIEDAEALVLAYRGGKGKYVGMLGSLKVQSVDGIEFYIGTGFSDIERQNPPPIGSVITYEYTGLTAKGVPRFARFKRARPEYHWNRKAKD